WAVSRIIAVHTRQKGCILIPELRPTRAPATLSGVSIVSYRSFPHVLLLAICVLLPAIMFAQTSVTGQWSAVQTWPTTGAGRVPTHAMLLPTGKVFYYSSYADGTTPHFWDPASNAVTGAPL